MTGLWLVGDEGVEEKRETTMLGYLGLMAHGSGFRRNGKENGNYRMGYVGTTIRIHPFIPS